MRIFQFESFPVNHKFIYNVDAEEGDIRKQGTFFSFIRTFLICVVSPVITSVLFRLGVVCSSKQKQKLKYDDIICYEEVKKKEQDKLDEKKEEKKKTKKKKKKKTNKRLKSRIVKTLCVPNGGMGIALRRLHRALFIT